MGFLFTRVMRFYAMNYRDTLSLPIPTFWLLSNNINRLSAEEDIRKLSVSAGAGSDKGFKETNEALRREMGEIFKRPEIVEIRSGLNKLKEISNAQAAQK